MNKKYVYKICGWVYDPVEHDNVVFEDLPEDWRCPVYKTFLANLSSYG